MRKVATHAAGFSVRLMNPAPATSTLASNIVTQLVGDLLSQFARLLARLLREHHGGIRREVPVGGIARRIDRRGR